LTRQAIHLDQLPPFNIVQTSREAYGQIYIPGVNWVLMVATLTLVYVFRSSDALAGAYGVAVAADMLVTTVLAFFVARRWGLFPLAATIIAGLLLIVDSAFFVANLFKIPDGGWIPLLVAGGVFFIMATWRRGRELMHTHLRQEVEPLDEFIAGLADSSYPRVAGTAVFLTTSRVNTPPMLMHHLRHNQVLHEQVILLTVHTHDVPRVRAAERLRAEDLGHGISRLDVHYGFMQAA